jgi:MFS family permease
MQALSGNLWSQLRHQPRLVAFIALQVPLSAVPGALFALVLNPLAADQLNGSSGIGLLGSLSSLAFAVSAVLVGVLADRFNPRTMMIVSLSVYAIATVAVCVLVLIGIGSFELLTYAVVSAFAAAFYIAPALKVEAALAPKPLRGSADILYNVLRFTCGLVGFQIVAAASDDLMAIILLTLVGGASGWASWWVARTASFSTVAVGSGRHGASVRDSSPGLIAGLRATPTLRAAVIADLALRIALPTQLIALFAVDYKIGSLLNGLTFAGMAGSATGRIAIVFIGLGGNLRARLNALLVSWAILCVLASASLRTDPDLNATVALSTFAFLGSTCIALLIGSLSGVTQQTCPDEIRGRISGSLMGIKTFVEIAGLWIVTYAITVWHTDLTLILLATMAIATIVGLRAFRGIPSF